MKTLIKKAKECDGEFCEMVAQLALVLGTIAIIIHTLVGLQTVI